MTAVRAVTAGLLWLAAAAVSAGARAAEPETIGSLAGRTVEIPESGAIAGSTDKARESYRRFLDTVSDDPKLRAEAMRRLADLELEAAQAAEASGAGARYGEAVELFQQLLEAYPDYRRSDRVLYQLARAYELGGDNDDALRVLDELVERHPDTALIAEVQFRRGEMLFLRREYGLAEAAYRQVVREGAEARFYEQSLYKLGWARFKQARHEDSLDPFFDLLDLKLAGIELGDVDGRLAALGRAERELVEDTFRVLSISFSYMAGPKSIGEHLERHRHPEYAWLIYLELGELYLEKKRYVDAAGAYGAFVERDPWHPQAPLLQVEVIEAYRSGSFPTLVLEAKENFVERYGMDGPYWQRNPPEAHAAAKNHLKANLNDLARYYHAAAQEKGGQEDYRRAARWYRKYLDWFPGEPDSAGTNFLLAEILFESGDYAAATLEYERTAYEYPRHGRSAEAGYAAVLAYRRREETLTGAAKSEWHDVYLDSALRFAETFPEHAESATVLTTVAEDLFGDGQFEAAIAVAETAVARTPLIDDALGRTAWTVIAHAEFDLGRYAKAEEAYYRLRPLTPAGEHDALEDVDERIASSIYKQGELARNDGDLETAVRHFLRLGEAVPDSAIRATAEYDAAAALVNIKAWDRAAAVLEAHRRNHADSPLAGEVTQKLAVSYAESGRNAEAAREFERIAASASGEVAREALWRASELYRADGKTPPEERVLLAFADRFPDPVAESIEARQRLLEIAESAGDAALGLQRLEAIVRADRAAGSQRSDRTRFLAAKAALALAEPAHRRFQSTRLSQPLADSIKRKKARMEEVLEAYARATDYGVAEVTTAATHRLGEVYRQFARDLMESERPGDLDIAALEQYDLLLEEQAFPFEEEAIALFEVNVARAADGLYDEWVRRSFDALAELVPARYAKLERSEDVVTALY
jgi:cellulose synthase operon protein C